MTEHVCRICGVTYKVLPDYRTMVPTPMHHEGEPDCLTIAELRKALADNREDVKTAVANTKRERERAEKAEALAERRRDEKSFWQGSYHTLVEVHEKVLADRAKLRAQLDQQEPKPYDDDCPPKLVIQQVTAEDTIQLVVIPELRAPIDEILLQQFGLKRFPIPVEAGQEDDDLPTFGLQRAR